MWPTDWREVLEQGVLWSFPLLLFAKFALEFGKIYAMPNARDPFFPWLEGISWIVGISMLLAIFYGAPDDYGEGSPGFDVPINERWALGIRCLAVLGTSFLVGFRQAGGHWWRPRQAIRPGTASAAGSNRSSEWRMRSRTSSRRS